MIGNVIFFKKDNSLLSEIVANITKSEFTHVALIVGFDDLTNVATIIESNRFVATRITTTVINENHVIYSPRNITNDERDRVVKYAFKQLGKKYDYFQILGLFISLLLKGDRYVFFNSSNKLICSELVDRVYLQSGIKRKDMLNVCNITPFELIDKYSMIKGEGGCSNCL